MAYSPREHYLRERGKQIKNYVEHGWDSTAYGIRRDAAYGLEILLEDFDKALQKTREEHPEYSDLTDRQVADQMAHSEFYHHTKDEGLSAYWFFHNHGVNNTMADVDRYRRDFYTKEEWDLIKEEYHKEYPKAIASQKYSKAKQANRNVHMNIYGTWASYGSQ